MQMINKDLLDNAASMHNRTTKMAKTQEINFELIWDILKL